MRKPPEHERARVFFISVFGRADNIFGRFFNQQDKGAAPQCPPETRLHIPRQGGGLGVGQNCKRGGTPRGVTRAQHCQGRAASCPILSENNRSTKPPEFSFENSGGFVRIKGLEPPRRKALDPKSNVATNYTISANLLCKGSQFADKIKPNRPIIGYFS